MDHIERRGRILVALALYWCLHMIVQHGLDIQALAFNKEWKKLLNFEHLIQEYEDERS